MDPDTSRIPTDQPETIGKYRVLRELGRGAMGRVFLGEDPHLGRTVAIKVLLPAADEDSRQRFLQEARVVGGFFHPNIVVLLEFGFHEDQPFLVMEHLQGVSLEQWLLTSHPLAAHLRILRGLCAALDHAHERGILHRDIKPSNIQVLPSGEAKLMDFGIARGPMAGMTATGMVLGTPEYMAPELLRDQPGSRRSDHYALALVFYRALTGRQPFSGRTLEACLTKVLTVEPESLAALRPDLPQGLAREIERHLVKRPEDRPGSLDDLSRAVDQALRALGDGAADDTTRAMESAATHRLPSGESKGATHGTATADADADADDLAPTVRAPRPSPPPRHRRRRIMGPVAVLGVVVLGVATWFGVRPLEPPASPATADDQATTQVPPAPPSTPEAADPFAEPAARPVADQAADGAPEPARVDPIPRDDGLSSSPAAEPVPDERTSDSGPDVHRTATSSSPPPPSTPPPSTPPPSTPTQPTPTQSPAQLRSQAESSADSPAVDPERGTSEATEVEPPVESGQPPPEPPPTRPEGQPAPPVQTTAPPPNAGVATPISEDLPPELRSMSPAVVRRGQVTEVTFEGAFARDLERLTLRRGRREVSGLRLLDLRREGDSQVRAQILVDESVALGIYSLVVVDTDGDTSNSLRLEVTL